MSNEEELKLVVNFAIKNKGKNLPLFNEFVKAKEGKLIGYNASKRLLIFRLPLNIGWVHDVIEENDIILYTRFKLEKYTYCYTSIWHYVLI